MSNKRKVYCLIAVVLAAAGLIVAALAVFYDPLPTREDAIVAVVNLVESQNANSKRWALLNDRETYNEYYLKNTGEMIYHSANNFELAFEVLVITKSVKDDSVVKYEVWDCNKFGFTLIYRDGRWIGKCLG